VRKINIGDIALLPKAGRVVGIRESIFNPPQLEVTIEYSYELDEKKRTCQVTIPTQLVEHVTEEELKSNEKQR